jgi:hypothetical protein
MKRITSLFLTSFLAITALSQISTNGVYVQDGITTEVGKKIYEISPTNKPTLLYFSNGLITRVNTNSDFLINSFFQDVENTDTFPQVARFGLCSLNVTLTKGNALFKYPSLANTNSSCVISTPLLDVELHGGLFYVESSETKVIVAVLEGELKSYNGKKESIITKGQAVIAEPNDVGILEDKITVKPGKVNAGAMSRLNDDALYLRSYEDSLFFIRINGQTIGVDK